MMDIRRELFRYADLKCHLWNEYFIDLFTGLEECEPLDSFDEIDDRLFKTLVCRPLGIKLPDYSYGKSRAIKQIVIRPQAHTSEIVIMFRIPDTQRNIWEKNQVIKADGMSCWFIDFFQWDRYDYLKLPLVECVVFDWPAHPELVGREALIEPMYLDFFLAGSEKENDADG